MEGLQHDCMALIFRYLGPADLAAAACTCRHWRAAASDEELWEALCRRLWPSLRLPLLACSSPAALPTPGRRISTGGSCKTDGTGRAVSPRPSLANRSSVGVDDAGASGSTPSGLGDQLPRVTGTSGPALLGDSIPALARNAADDLAEAPGRSSYRVLVSRRLSLTRPRILYKRIPFDQVLILVDLCLHSNVYEPPSGLPQIHSSSSCFSSSSSSSSPASSSAGWSSNSSTSSCSSRSGSSTPLSSSPPSSFSSPLLSPMLSPTCGPTSSSASAAASSSPVTFASSVCSLALRRHDLLLNDTADLGDFDFTVRRFPPNVALPFSTRADMRMEHKDRPSRYARALRLTVDAVRLGDGRMLRLLQGAPAYQADDLSMLVFCDTLPALPYGGGLLVEADWEYRVVPEAQAQAQARVQGPHDGNEAAHALQGNRANSIMNSVARLGRRCDSSSSVWGGDVSSISSTTSASSGGVVAETPAAELDAGRVNGDLGGGCVTSACTDATRVAEHVLDCAGQVAAKEERLRWEMRSLRLSVKRKTTFSMASCEELLQYLDHLEWI